MSDIPLSQTMEEIGDTSCSVCLDLMIEPVETNCNHRFCKNCLLKWLMAVENRIKCALCRTRVTKVAELPELKILIQDKLVEKLEEEEKKEWMNEVGLRATDPKILELGSDPFPKVLQRNAPFPGFECTYISNEYGEVTELELTFNGEFYGRVPYHANRSIRYSPRWFWS